MILMETRRFSAWWACLSRQAEPSACPRRATRAGHSPAGPGLGLKVPKFNPLISAPVFYSQDLGLKTD